eukprot:547164_1
MRRFFQKSTPFFRRIGSISLPICASLGLLSSVPTESDAPEYVKDVFKNFSDRYLKQTNQKQIVRIGLIGAGPSGLSLLNAFNKELQDNEEKTFEIICFDKQSEIGGLWNYDCRTGTDEYGLNVHASQYKHLWSNGPKECLEMPDYTFEKHFNGQNISSFPPREVLKDYILGRVKTNELENKFDIRLNHNIIDVKQTNNKFELIYHNLLEDTIGSQVVDYLVVASGHFSTPNIVEFEGFDTFNGRILHSHSFRNASEFKGQNVLIIGGSYSAEDIALQCWKFGAKNVVISNRKPMNFHWPKGVLEVPLLKKVINGNDIELINNSVVQDIDSIILCTGYLHSFPFLPPNLKLKTKNILYPNNLYKGVIWINNPKLIYLGMTDQWYTFTMFDMQSLYAKDVILNKIELPSKRIMIDDAFKWRERGTALNMSANQCIQFQTDYILDLYKQLSNPNEYCDDKNKLNYSNEFNQWEHDKHDNILTYRDKCFKSKLTGIMSTKFHTLWTNSFDDSLENFLSSKPIDDTNVNDEKDKKNTFSSIVKYFY